MIGGLSQLCRLVTGERSSSGSSVESRSYLTAADVCKESKRVRLMLSRTQLELQRYLLLFIG